MQTHMIPHWLTKQASLHPHKPAFEFEDGRSMTFLQLKQKSQGYAKRLASLEIRPNSRVAILSNNQLDMVLAIHALSYLGAVVVLLNTRLSRHEILDQLRRSKATYLLTENSNEVVYDLEGVEQFTFQAIQQMPKVPVALMEEIDLNRPFTIMFTSGTTGAPKGVVHTYGNHWWSAIGSVLNLGLVEEDKWLLTLPIFHVGGFSILIRSLVYGMTVYFLDRYRVAALKRAFTDGQVTIASLVTLMLQELVEELGGQSLPAHVRCILLGGGSVPETLLEKVESLQIPLFQSYGMTETSSQIVTLSAAFARTKLGSAGKALLPANVKIAGANEEGIGEILVKGPMVFHGYDQLEALNKEIFTDGWFHTGDLGYLDSEGFLYVVERRTDLIISGGENIYPTEVEHRLLEIEGIKEAAVVGKKDKKWGQVPVAFLVTSPSFDIGKVPSYLQESLAKYKIPKEFILLDRLPRNASNKIMRHQLAAQINDPEKNDARNT